MVGHMLTFQKAAVQPPWSKWWFAAEARQTDAAQDALTPEASRLLWLAPHLLDINLWSPSISRQKACSAWSPLASHFHNISWGLLRLLALPHWGAQTRYLHSHIHHDIHTLGSLTSPHWGLHLGYNSNPSFHLEMSKNKTLEILMFVSKRCRTMLWP